MRWQAVGGKTYVVEAAGDLTGTNAFTNASVPLEVVGNGEFIADFVHEGGATNGTPRFYRVRLVP